MKRINERKVFEKIEDLILDKINGSGGYLSVESDHDGKIFSSQLPSSLSYDQDQHGRVAQVIYAIEDYENVDDVLRYAYDCTIESEREYNPDVAKKSGREVAKEIVETVEWDANFCSDIREKIKEAEAEIARVAKMKGDAPKEDRGKKEVNS